MLNGDMMSLLGITSWEAWLLLVILQSSVDGIVGHGRLLEPPSRASMWRMGFSNPPDYNDNQLSCGGASVQHEMNGGKCGVCGDPYNVTGDHEAGGKFANGIIGRVYKPGQIIDVIVDITANHLGWMEFHICPNDNPFVKVTEACLSRRPLQPVDGQGSKVIVTADMVGPQSIKLRLPKDMQCVQCVIRWKYIAGNSWGTDKASGESCTGCGNQESFYSCADVSIGDTQPWWDAVRGIHADQTTTVSPYAQQNWHPTSNSYALYQASLGEASPTQPSPAPTSDQLETKKEQPPSKKYEAPSSASLGRPPTAEELNDAFLERMMKKSMELVESVSDEKKQGKSIDSKKVYNQPITPLDVGKSEKSSQFDPLSLYASVIGYPIGKSNREIVTLPTTTRAQKEDRPFGLFIASTPLPNVINKSGLKFDFHTFNSKKDSPGFKKEKFDIKSKSIKKGTPKKKRKKKPLTIYDLDFGDVFKSKKKFLPDTTIRPLARFGKFNFSAIPMTDSSKDKSTVAPIILKPAKPKKTIKKKITKHKQDDQEKGTKLLKSVLKGEVGWFDIMRMMDSTTTSEPPSSTMSSMYLKGNDPPPNLSGMKEIPVLYRSHSVAAASIPYVSSVSRSKEVDTYDAAKSMEHEVDSDCTLIVIGEENGEPTYLAVCDDSKEKV